MLRKRRFSQAAPSEDQHLANLAPQNYKTLAKQLAEKTRMNIGSMFGGCLGSCPLWVPSFEKSNGQKWPSLVGMWVCTIAAKSITYKQLFTKKCFGTINFIKLQIQYLYKANSLFFFVAQRDTPVATTLQRKSSGGIIFCVITKDYYKRKCSKELFCNYFGQDGNFQKTGS